MDGMSRGDSVKIRSHPGASTEDLIGHIKPGIRKSPDTVVIHTNTNDSRVCEAGGSGREESSR